MHDATWEIQADLVEHVLGCLELFRYAPKFKDVGYDGKQGLLDLLKQDPECPDETLNGVMHKLLPVHRKRLQSWIKHTQKMAGSSALNGSPEGDQSLLHHGLQKAYSDASFGTSDSRNGPVGVRFTDFEIDRRIKHGSRPTRQCARQSAQRWRKS